MSPYAEKTFEVHQIRLQKLLSLAVIVVGLAIALWITPYSVVDDAWISYRYAENLATRGELVFNHGDRVEGITNLLWATLISIPTRFSSVSPENSAKALEVLFLALSFYRLWQLGSALGGSPWIGTLAASVLILTPEFMGTALNGLEAASYTYLQLELIYRYVRNEFTPAFLVSALLFMTRPEGLAFTILLTAAVYFERRSLRGAYLGLGLAAGAILCTTLFRYLYFGSIVPNTVIAKSFPLQLLASEWKSAIVYDVEFARANPHLVVMFIVSLVWLFVSFVRKAKLDTLLLFCVIGIACSGVVAFRNGGDWMPSHRLLLQYGALFAVMAIVLLRHKIVRTLVLLSLLALPVLFSAYDFGKRKDSSTFLSARREEDFWSQVAFRLRPVLTHRDSISAEAIGYISYILKDTYFHDPLGLLDRHIARYGRPAIPFGKKDLSYTMKVVRPAIMVWQHAKGMRSAEPELAAQYQGFCYPDSNPDSPKAVFIRRDRLQDLGPVFEDWKRIRIENGILVIN